MIEMLVYNILKNQQQFLTLREQFPTFTYKGYSLTKENNNILITYDFCIDGLTSFSPSLRIPLDNMEEVNAFDSPRAQQMVFSLGMVELISYWKCSCPPQVNVLCGALDDDDVYFWKKLYYHGLGEFFFINGIETDFDSFMQISAKEKIADEKKTWAPYINHNLNLIPVGGGKDSNVTLERLKEQKQNNRVFMINPRGAITKSAEAANYTQDESVIVYRSIDAELLRLNKEGFLNGHTPFSAIVAFLSLYCAYLIGAEHILLSNESSANEGNIAGLDVNHQYSKSYAFETDFGQYVRKNLVDDIHYFSFLRAFNELQIAKQFAAYPQYFSVFKSCNRGSKEDIWCCNCSKCLFVYLLLFPFLGEETMVNIMGEDLYAKESLLPTLEELAGFSDQKPFECVGTSSEVRFALSSAVLWYQKQGKALPVLLQVYDKQMQGVHLVDDVLLKAFNNEHHIQEQFMKEIKGMYRYVSGIE